MEAEWSDDLLSQKFFGVCWRWKRNYCNFSSGNTSNCLGRAAKYDRGFLQMQSWCKYVVFGVHNYAKCKSPKPQCLRGQQLKPRTWTGDAPSQAGGALKKTAFTQVDVLSPTPLFFSQTHMSPPVFFPPHPCLGPFTRPWNRAVAVQHPRGCNRGSLRGTAPAPPIHLCLLAGPGRVTDHLTLVLMTNKSTLALKLQYMDPQEYIQTEAGARGRGGGVEKSAEGEVPRRRQMRCGEGEVRRKKTQRVETPKKKKKKKKKGDKDWMMWKCVYCTVSRASGINKRQRVHSPAVWSGERPHGMKVRKRKIEFVQTPQDNTERDVAAKCNKSR